MKRLTGIRMVLGAIILSVSLTVPNGWAQEEEGLPQKTAGVSAGTRKQIEELKKLRQENPEKFKQVIQERQKKLKERLARLKETNPQEYQKVIERLRQNRQKRLEWLKKNNPEKFKELMQQRRENLKNRLAHLKETNPEQYEKAMQKIRQHRIEKLKDLKKHDPEKYRQFLENHPRLRDGLKDGRDRREDVLPGREDIRDKYNFLRRPRDGRRITQLPNGRYDTGTR